MSRRVWQRSDFQTPCEAASAGAPDSAAVAQFCLTDTETAWNAIDYEWTGALPYPGGTDSYFMGAISRGALYLPCSQTCAADCGEFQPARDQVAAVKRTNQSSWVLPDTEPGPSARPLPKKHFPDGGYSLMH